MMPLTMAIQMYLAPRAVMARSLVSEIFEFVNGAVAGRRQAAGFAGPLLYRVLDAAHGRYAFVVSQQYLGNLALQIGGRA